MLSMYVCMYYVHTCGHRGFSMLKTSHYIPNLNPSEFSHDYLSTTVALALVLIVLIATCQN